MRTDVLFRPSEKEPWRPRDPPQSCFDNPDLDHCAAVIAAQDSKALRACQARITAVESASWRLNPENDRAIVGSRDLLLNHAFTGLEWLANITNRNSTHSWNPAQWMNGGSPMDMPGCYYGTPILRMGEVVGGHWQHLQIRQVAVKLRHAEAPG